MKDQSDLPGMAPVRDSQVEKAIKDYVEFRDERMRIGKLEKEKKVALIGIMKEKKIDHYNVDGVQADLEVEDKIHAKISQGGPDGNDRTD